MKKLSRAEAKSSGIAHYFTGKPCKNGHIAARFTSTCACTECNSERSIQKAEWYKSNRRKVLERAKRNYEDNREKKIKAACMYQKRNLRKIIEARSVRIQSDPVYALKERVRCLIKECIKNSGSEKKSCTSEILGCDTKEFKRYIELQFTKGMGWHNMGQWHLDHIVPISSAETEEDVIALNHHTNLRPLWASENLRKSNKMEFLI